MSLPDFSIAMPVGAWSPLLPAALRSLTLQDATLRVALLDASGDPRVAEAADASGLAFAYRRHAPDAGQSAAIAEGWANTGGAILGWLNADDVLTPGALGAAAAAFAADPGLDVWFGQSSIVDDSGATVGVHGKTAEAGPLLRRSNTISQPSCFARRTAVEAVGGLDAGLHYTMDWDLWVRLYDAGRGMRMTERYLSAVLWAKGTKTASLSPARMREIARIVGRNHGPYTTAKTLVGFAQHYAMFDTGPGAALARLMRRGAARRAREDGLSGSGWLSGEAFLPVLNLSDAPRSRLLVEFAGADAHLARAAASGHLAEGPAAMLQTDPTAPGQAVMVTLSAPAEANVYFARARWTD